MEKQIAWKVSCSQRGLWEFGVAIIFSKKMIAFSRLLLRVELLHAFLLPRAFSVPLELLSVCTQVDVMHEERSSITYDSSIVLTWNIAAKCQEKDKD